MKIDLARHINFFKKTLDIQLVFPVRSSVPSTPYTYIHIFTYVFASAVSNLLWFLNVHSFILLAFITLHMWDKLEGKNVNSYVSPKYWLLKVIKIVFSSQKQRIINLFLIKFSKHDYCQKKNHSSWNHYFIILKIVNVS